MKLLVVFLSAAAVCSGNAIPLVPGDNSHYVEGESRYIWMPDGEGVPILVDLQAPVKQKLIPLRNGSDNQYWLFTRRNPTSRQVITIGDVNGLRSSNYNGNLPTKVIVHGYGSNGNTEMNPLITSAFLAAGDVNVIVVDYNRVANSPYSAALVEVPGVGRHIGDFITWLFDNGGGTWNNLHMVGFSLGSHVTGIAGRHIGGRAARVTGLDPAAAQWRGNPLALNPNSGVYVEVIHTDGRSLGIMDPIGDADFYPNGGRNPQPGCLFSGCSHRRATELFAATIQFNHLIGRQCANLLEAELNLCRGATLNLGNGVLGKRGSGLFGLHTGRTWPF